MKIMFYLKKTCIDFNDIYKKETNKARKFLIFIFVYAVSCLKKEIYIKFDF